LAVLTLFFLVLGTCKSPSSTKLPDNLLKLSGTITLNSQGFVNVNVYLSQNASKKVTTGSDGKYAFNDLAPSSYFITPSMIGYAFSPSNYEVVMASRSDLNFSAQIAKAGSELGSIATNFSAKDQNNNNVSLYDYHGKVILMDFTADWCTSCREKAETAEQFYQSYKNRGFMYILIVIEGSASLWASTYGLTFPVLDDNSQAIYNIYRKGSIPLPHVLDHNCTIRYKKEGWNKAEVEDAIKKYL